MKKKLSSFILFLVLLIPVLGNSHEPDQSFIYLRIYENNGIEGRFELNVNELNEVLGLGLPKYPTIEQFKAHEEVIKEYILKNASFRSDRGEYKIVFTGEVGDVRTNYGWYGQFHFRLQDSEDLPDEIDIAYLVFLEENPGHRNMVTIEYNWKAGLINNETVFALDFTKGDGAKTLDLTDTSLWKGFVAMVRQGVWHIWIGLDHILFLVALILPSVVRRRKELQPFEGYGDKEKRAILGWVPVLKFRPAFIYIIKVITFFTIAHTITLSLASLNLINLPSRLVETIIAFSIGLAAYHNIKPIFKGRDWIIAFVFGLFHGFGFASVLADLGFKGEFLTLSLLGFNLGVELGQVAIIAAIFPILYLIRKFRLYPRLLVGISIVLIIISLYWFIERAFDIDLPIDNYLRVEGYKIAVRLGLR